MGVIMCTHIQFHKLCEVAESFRAVSLSTEVTDVKESHTTVAVEFHARLVSPEIYISVEVPVGT